MTPVIDLTDQRFGRVLVLKRYGRDYFGQITWLCKCDCANEQLFVGTRLRGGRIKQCAKCTRRQGGKSLKHIREFRSWGAMQRRCLNPKDICFRYYGGRGIKICDRWLGPGGFVNFLKDMGKRPEGKTLDRRNPEGDYTPENCRWASPKTQTDNRRRNYTDEELKVMQEEAEQSRARYAAENAELEKFEAEYAPY